MRIFILAAASVLLAACSGGGSVTEGTHAELSAVNGKSASNSEGAPTAEGEVTYQTFYTSGDKRIDLQQGLLVVQPLELEECPSLASAAHALGRMLVGEASAHSAHAAAPGGVIDVAVADGTAFDLGEVDIAPGRYCSATLALATLPAGANGAGALLYVAPCYYPDSGSARTTPGLPFYPDEVNHACYDNVPVPAPVAADARVLTLDLSSTPVEVSSDKRHGEIALRIEYDTWFDGVDVDALGCDAVAGSCDEPARIAAQAQLIDNVKASIRLAPAG